jgi:hypothetical protein
MDTKTPITETHDAHNMGKDTTSSPDTGNHGTDARSAVLATITRMQEQQRNDLAYLAVMAELDSVWKVMQVKRRFDRSQ